MSRLKVSLTLVAAGPLVAATVSAPAAGAAPEPTITDTTTTESSAETVPVTTGAEAAVWDPEVEDTVEVSPATAQDIVQDYWTPDRMAQAQPAPAPDGAAANAETESGLAPDDEGTRTQLAEPAPADEVTPLEEAHFSYTNGRVMFRNPNDGGDYWCSGGAVNSDSNRLVVTAGHCVHPGDGGDDWMENWVFVPGYHEGSEPRGTFSAYWFHSSTGWTQDENFDRDFGFVVTYTNGSGQRLVNAVGGHGLTTNPGYPYVHIAGYPGNRENGEVQWNCWGDTVRTSVSDSRPELNCDFGGGSSGGPWLRDFDDSGLGYVVTNMSTIDGDGNNRGPYYDDHVGDVFDSAGSNTP